MPTRRETTRPWNPYYGHRQKDFAAECRRISERLCYPTPFKDRAEREAFRDDVMLLTHALWCWLSQAEPLGIKGQELDANLVRKAKSGPEKSKT